MKLRLRLVSLFVVAEVLTLPGAGSRRHARFVTKTPPQLRGRAQMSESSLLPNYDVERACELMIESLGLYADSRGTYGGKLNEPNYKCVYDSQGKKQLVLSVDRAAAAATVVFRGTARSPGVLFFLARCCYNAASAYGTG